MILEWLIAMCAGLGIIVMQLFPDNSAADALMNASNAVSTLVGYTTGIGVWIPWGLIAAAIGVTFAAWASIFVFKIVRQLLAHVPFVGGTG